MTPRLLATTKPVLSEDAAGWLFCDRWTTDAERTIAMLRAWRRGAIARRWGSWLVLTYAQEELIEAPPAGATQLLRLGIHWTAVPIDAIDAQGIDNSRGPSLLFAHNGELHQLPFQNAKSVDLLELLPKVNTTLLQLSDLEAPPVPMTLAEIPAPRSTKGVLGNAVPEAAAEQQEVLASLRQNTAVSFGERALERILAFLFRLWARTTPQHRAHQHLPARPPRRSGPSIWSALSSTLRLWLLRSSFGHFFLTQQERYLTKLQRMLRERNYEEALRHAIPLSADVRNSLSKMKFSLGFSPRQDLSISPQSAASGSTALLGGDAFGSLKTMYQRAAAELAARGEHERAAFVHIELLNDARAGIALLESATHYAQAAEICEGRKVSPAWSVRLWLLAGNEDRALALAADHDAFREAIDGLGEHPDAQRYLRLRWADRLAGAGQFDKAIRAVHGVKAADPLVRTWLDEAMATGGKLAADTLALVINAQTFPFETLRPALEQLLDDPGFGGANARLELAANLKQGSHPSLPALLRQLTIDEAKGHTVVPAKLRRSLAQACPDRALGEDVATLPSTAPTNALRLPWESAEGPRVFDAVPLSDGGMLLALGEGGASVLSADGSVRFRLPEPCDRIVIAENSARALLLHRRGKLLQAARADLVQGRSEGIGMLELDAWANVFDGSRWFVRQGTEVFALDVLSSPLRRGWAVQDPLLNHAELALRPGRLHVLAPWERWDYNRSTMTLKARMLIAPPEGVLAADLLTGKKCVWVRHSDEGLALETSDGKTVRLESQQMQGPIRLRVEEDQVILGTPVRTFVLDARSMTTNLCVQGDAHVRVFGHHAAVYAPGRIARVDLRSRQSWMNITLR